MVCVRNYVVRNYDGNIYNRAKFCPNRLRTFGSAHAWFRAPRHRVTQLFFGSWERLQPRRAQRFWRKIRQMTRFLLVVAKLISKVWTPIFHKTAIHFSAPFRRDNFFVKNRFNVGRLESKRPLIVIVAQYRCMVSSSNRTVLAHFALSDPNGSPRSRP